jgi:eukaryotic-like serine/threonine-protein kinase
VQHGGPLAPARVVHLLRQLCGVLVEAHAVGLVHRDIRPANLMLCVRGFVSDYLKVLDFGLVKEPAEGGNPSVTNTSALIGTPSYMAPEAILNPTGVAAGADIYSVGAVAYFLLVGEPVFVGVSSMEVCVKHVHQPPPLASSRSSQPIPKQLEDLVMACRRKEPAERPRSAAELTSRLLELEAELVWSQRDADAWWQSSSREVIASSQAQHDTPGQSPGPQTLAIDWAAGHALTAAA